MAIINLVCLYAGRFQLLRKYYYLPILFLYIVMQGTNVAE